MAWFSGGWVDGWRGGEVAGWQGGWVAERWGSGVAGWLEVVAVAARSRTCLVRGLGSEHQRPGATLHQRGPVHAGQDPLLRL